MEFLYPLNAIHIDGGVILLYTLDEVHAFIRKHGRFTEHHVEWYYDPTDWARRRPVKASGWIVRDDRGRTVKYDDVCIKYPMYYGWNQRNAEIRAIAAKGLPIPHTGCRKAGWKQNHPAKKNSGSGHRNRNRAKAIYEAKEYGVKNDVGGRVIPWENY